MSADNWTHCPRCTKTGEAALDARAQGIKELYGEVSIEEFDIARRDLSNAWSDFEQRDETFREDYEFYGADSGVVTVSYRGECQSCGLLLEIDEKHQIPGV